MAREKKIIDASIGVKWFSQEIGTSQAQALLKDHINERTLLIVPDLFYYEVINALRYKTEPESIIRALNDLDEFQLHIEHVSVPLLARAIQIAKTYELTIYDATYLALAELRQVDCITTDKKMLSSKHPKILALD